MHPCLRCGACCAQHSVVFDWYEGDDITPDGVPQILCRAFGRQQRCMAGTEDGGRCIALEGVVGQETRCSIHARRPSICRAFAASYERGRREKRCERARARYGLLPLTASDWIGLEPKKE